MGNCLASSVEGSEGNGSVAVPVLTTAAGEGQSNTELVALLKSGTFEQRLAALQRLAKATAKTDDDCAAARFSLIEEEDVLAPLTQLLRANQRPALRAAAAQAFCNLSYACMEALEPAHKLGKSLEGAGEGLRSLILTDAVRDGPLTACQALSNLSRAPELVQPLLLALGRLNNIANHIVMSPACDVVVKASFAQLLLNASLHSVLEVQQLDCAGGLAAALKLLDDPKGNATVHERALCALHNLIRAHQLLLSTLANTSATLHNGDASRSCASTPCAHARALLAPTHSNPMEGSPCSAKGSVSQANHSGTSHCISPTTAGLSSPPQQPPHSPPPHHTSSGTSNSQWEPRPTTANSNVLEGEATLALVTTNPVKVDGHCQHAAPADPHSAAVAAAPRYAELLRLPQVQTALQRQLRRPPLLGGTAGSSNCRFLAAKVVRLLVEADQQQHAAALQGSFAGACDGEKGKSSSNNGGMSHRGAPLPPGNSGALSHRGGTLSNRDSMAGSLKHMAMSQLLEALQHALLQTPPEPQQGALRFQPPRPQQAPPSAYGSPHKQPCAVDASTDSLQLLNGLRSPASPNKGSPGGGTPCSACTSTCAQGAMSPRYIHSWASLSTAGGLGTSSAWAGRGGTTSVAALPHPQPPLYGAHEQLLEALVGGLLALCIVCCRPPRGHLPVLAQGTADRLVLLIGRRGPNAPPMLRTCANMLCLMSGVDHSRKQMVSAAAVPALVDLLSAALHPFPTPPRSTTTSSGAVAHVTLQGQGTTCNGSPAKSPLGTQQPLPHQPQLQHNYQHHHRHQSSGGSPTRPSSSGGTHTKSPLGTQQSTLYHHQQQQQQQQQLHRHQGSGGSSSLPSSATKQPSSPCSEWTSQQQQQQQQQGAAGGTLQPHSRRQLFGPSHTHADPANEDMWCAAAAAAKALRNMAVGCPAEVLGCARAMPQLLAGLAAHLPPPPASCATTPMRGAAESPQIGRPKDIAGQAVAAGGPTAQARASVQRQCLTALISLTRSEPAATCQAVLDVQGCMIIAEAIHLGLQCSSTHGTQVAAWNAALLCQLYISPLEDAARAIHAAVRAVISAEQAAQGAGACCAATNPVGPAAAAVAAAGAVQNVFAANAAVGDSVVSAPTIVQIKQQQQQQQPIEVQQLQCWVGGGGGGKRKTWQQQQQQQQEGAAGLRSSHASLRNSLAAKEIGSLLKVAGPLPDTHADSDQTTARPTPATNSRYGPGRNSGQPQHVQRTQRADVAPLTDTEECDDAMCNSDSSSSLLCESGCEVQLSASSGSEAEDGQTGVSVSAIGLQEAGGACRARWGPHPPEQQQQQQQQQQHAEGPGETDVPLALLDQQGVEKGVGGDDSQQWGEGVAAAAGEEGAGEQEREVEEVLSFLERLVQLADPVFLESDSTDAPA